MDALDLWRLVHSLPQTRDDGRSESAGGWAGGGLAGRTDGLRAQRQLADLKKIEVIIDKSSRTCLCTLPLPLTSSPPPTVPPLPNSPPPTPTPVAGRRGVAFVGMFSSGPRVFPRARNSSDLGGFFSSLGYK